MHSQAGQAEWAARWKAAAPRLAAIRADELRRVDVAAFIESMADAFEAANASVPLPVTSGLVIQQRFFGKARA